MNHINSLMDLLKTVQSYKDYLDGKVSFDQQGRPVLKKEFFLDDWPDEMVTHQNRNSKLITDKSKTLLCLFSPDRMIYPRFVKIYEEIDEYKQFYGVVSPDLTVTNDMDIELQQLIIEANILFMTVLAVNGVKVALNTRNGLISPEQCFQNIPKGVMCSSGFLGCARASDGLDSIRYLSKILFLLPEKLAIYGKHDYEIEEGLDNVGIDYRRFDDFHAKTKKNRRN